MRLRKRFLPFLYSSLLFFATFVLFILFIDPSKSFEIYTLSIPALLVFFLLLFLFLFSLASFLLLSKRRGALVGIFFAGVLLLRYFGFKNILYVFLFLLILILVEIYYRASKKPPAYRKPSLPIHQS